MTLPFIPNIVSPTSLALAVGVLVGPVAAQSGPSWPGIHPRAIAHAVVTKFEMDPLTESFEVRAQADASSISNAVAVEARLPDGDYARAQIAPAPSGGISIVGDMRVIPTGDAFRSSASGATTYEFSFTLPKAGAFNYEVGLNGVGDAGGHSSWSGSFNLTDDAGVEFFAVEGFSFSAPIQAVGSVFLVPGYYFLRSDVSAGATQMGAVLIDYRVVLTPIPEPSTLMLLFLGLSAGAVSSLGRGTKASVRTLTRGPVLPRQEQS